jgi:hypothetical protein
MLLTVHKNGFLKGGVHLGILTIISDWFRLFITVGFTR